MRVQHQGLDLGEGALESLRVALVVLRNARLDGRFNIPLHLRRMARALSAHSLITICTAAEFRRASPVASELLYLLGHSDGRGCEADIAGDAGGDRSGCGYGSVSPLRGTYGSGSSMSSNRMQC